MGRWAIFMSLLAGCCGCSCMDQYNPYPFWNKLKQERITANRPTIKLTPEGKIPPKPVATVAAADKTGAAASESPTDKKYKAICATCHGETGKGDTPAAKVLKPNPRDFTDPKWQKSVTDDHIFKVIKLGGAANGLSPSMAPWGSMLKDDEIKELVKKIRGFGGK